MQNELSRRRVLQGLAAGGVAGGLAGCSGDGPSGDGEGTTSLSDEGTAQGTRVLRLSKSFDEDSLDPISTSWLPRWIGLQECLVRIDRDLKLVPALATSWSTNDDASSWRFELREDVTFHDGTEFTADAARWSLARTFSIGETTEESVTSSTPITSITAEDRYLLRIDLDKPFVPLPAYLALNDAAIARPQDTGENEEFDPVFTGPFEVESWTPNVRLVSVRNEDYYGSHPGIDRIEFEVVVDGETRELKLLNDELDMVWNQPVTSVSAFESDPNTEAYFQQKTQTRCLAFNTNSGPFAEKRVRQAANYALDEKANVENVLEGVGKLGVGPWPPDIYWANDELTAYTHDSQQAAKLLDDAGLELRDGVRYRDGEPLGITLHTYPTRANFRTLAEAMQAQLQDVGFKVELKLTDWSTMLEGKEQGNFDTTMEARTTFAYPPDPENLASLYHSKDSYMDTGYENEEVDKLLELGRATPDREERKRHYDRVQAIVMEDLPISYQSYMTVVHGTRSDVENFSPTHPVGNQYKLAGVSITPDE